MAHLPLDSETILSATESVLRRHGPRKATVVDVARALGVSHGSVYRHFPSKAALREAVTQRWLTRGLDELAALAGDTDALPSARLRNWLGALLISKRAMASGDPELFATYMELAAEHGAMAGKYVEDLLCQLRAIVTDGIATGDFADVEAEETARAIFNATSRFHHPAHADYWMVDGTEAELDGVCALLIDGLRPR
jgi:AcrR family transcriptional regulator